MTTPDSGMTDLLTDDAGAARLASAHRYAQVGMCVSSVTHDINNHLGVIMAYGELIGMEHDGNPETAHMVQEIVDAVKRANRLIEDLTAVARREAQDASRVAASDIAERVMNLRAYDMKIASVKCEKHLDDAGHVIECDRPRLEQALLYLVSNALEEALEHEEPFVSMTVHCDNDHISFDIKDAGNGPAPDIADTCFEPFFTTKQPPHLGLGLFAARRIAALHSGTVEFVEGVGMRLRMPLECGIERQYAEPK